MGRVSRAVFLTMIRAPKNSVPLGSVRRSCCSTGNDSSRSGWAAPNSGRVPGTHSGTPPELTATTVPRAITAKIAAAQVHRRLMLSRRLKGGA